MAGQSSGLEDPVSQLTGPPRDLNFPRKVKMWLGSPLTPRSAQAPKTRRVSSQTFLLHRRNVSWWAGGKRLFLAPTHHLLAFSVPELCRLDGALGPLESARVTLPEPPRAVPQQDGGSALKGEGAELCEALISRRRHHPWPISLCHRPE